MPNAQDVAAQLAYLRPFAARLARLGRLGLPLSPGVARFDGLVARLVETGLLGQEEWPARLTQVWQRDFIEVAQALWHRMGAAEEGQLCQKECGARCCHSAGLILSPREAEVLRQRGRELGLEVSILDEGGLGELGDGDPMQGRRWTLPAFPCPFLSSDKLCRVYPDRPRHCQLHPSYWREECPLSHRWYFPETNVARQPLGTAPAEVIERLARLTRARLG